MEKYKFGVFIGRFQPFHNSHLRAVREAINSVEHLIILVGSSNASRSIKNPFTFDERCEMIRSALGYPIQGLTIRPIRDHFYSDNQWVTQVQNTVNEIIKDEPNICLVGNYKDSSSYYLKYFPQWELLAVTADYLNATDIREKFFSGSKVDDLEVPPGVKDTLALFKDTDQYSNLVNELDMIRAYKRSWKDSPFPPVFVTVDAVVVSHGHVLVVRRKFNPGKGLLALPGGFIKQSERLEDACIRELREETGIKVPVPILKNLIKGSKVFDHPSRSTRGRTITHAFYLPVNQTGMDTPRHRQDLPEVRGGDDADHAMWIPFSRVFEDGIFYEDHADIISSFIVNA